MRFEDKLIRGKNLLSPGTDEGKNQYNVLHILVGTVLVVIIPLFMYFVSGGNVLLLYISQYIAVAMVGILIGYLAGCVPTITIMVIILASTGKLLYKLLGGKLGSFGSMEFNVRFLAWILLILVMIGFAYLGAKIKDKRLSGIMKGR